MSTNTKQINKCVNGSLAELSNTLKTLTKETSDPISGFKEFYTQTYQQLSISTIEFRYEKVGELK